MMGARGTIKNQFQSCSHKIATQTQKRLKASDKPIGQDKAKIEK